MEHALKSIIIVDDHKLFRQSLKTLLRQRLKGIEIREASSGMQLIDLLEKHGYRPDIILLDLEMPEMDGLEVTRTLLSRYKNPGYKIIVLTMHDEKSFILNLIDEGVHGYLLKSADVTEVLKAIHQVQKGQYYVSQNAFEAIRQNMASAPHFRSKFVGEKRALSAREVEILVLVCEEYTNKEIAEKLKLSIRTVDGHRNRLLKKTGMRNTAGLVKFALRSGFYSLD